MMRLPIEKPPVAVRLIWVTLGLAVLGAVFEGRASLAFVAVLTFVLTLMPLVFVKRMGIRLPAGFTVGIVLFIYATIFLGEAFDFYERYAWWDVILHGGSALGFGMIGFLLAFVLFEGDRYDAPAWALGFIGFNFAVTIGACWEVFEYTMDQVFGLNMQKSGLTDTMWDMIVNVVGAGFGGLAGFLYLKGREVGGPTRLIAQFVEMNRRLFRRDRDRG